MKQFTIIPIILIFMNGCVYFHEDGDEYRFGMSTHKYRDCIEYYDAAGVYHKECNNDLLKYEFSPEIDIKIDKAF